MRHLPFSMSFQTLIGFGTVALLTFQLSAQPFLPTEVGTTVAGFQDDFEGAVLGTNWVVAGANVYSVSSGLLHVTTATGDPNHLLLELPGYDNTVQEVLARVRVLSYGAGDYVRGGIAVAVDPNSSQGINYLFRDNTTDGQTANHLSFLDDLAAWGPAEAFVWQPNTWYWLRLRQEPNAASLGGVNDVFGKIWLADGTQPEPASWQLSWNYTPTYSTRSGYAGITASSGSPFQFDVDYILVKAAGLPSILVAPNAFVEIPVSITSQPQSQTVSELSPVSFSVAAAGYPPPAYQWFTASSVIYGATNPTYTINSAPWSANGTQFYAVARNTVSNVAYAVTSSIVSLTLIADTNPPVLLGAQTLGLSQVQVTFSIPVTSATATAVTNYSVTGSNGPVSILGASMPSQTNVVLAVNGLSDGGTYVLTVNHIAAQTVAGTLIPPGSTTNFFASSFIPAAIGNPQLAGGLFAVAGGLGVSSAGADIGGVSDQFQFGYEPLAGDFDLSVKVRSLNASDPFAKAGLMAREALTPGSRFAASVATLSLYGSFFEWRDPAASLARVNGHFPVNYPETWLRLKRAGTVFTGFASYDGLTWTVLGSASITLSNRLYVGLAASSHTTNQIAAIDFIAPAQAVTNALVGNVINPHEPLGACSRLTPFVISEIMYTPPARTDGNNVEFIELYNSNPYFEDLSGFQIGGGSISYTFPSGTILGGGAFLVVAASPVSMQNVYGSTNVTGPYSGTLKKSGTIQLINAQGGIVLTVPYSDTYPWPVAAHGTGHSIVLANPTYGEGDPRAWDVSDVIGGSPGQGEAFRPCPLRSVVINEVLAHTENPAVPQFIELYNHSDLTNDLSGCILTDDPTTNRFVIPTGTLLGPNGFVAFNQEQLGFSLDGAGGTVYLIKPDGSRVLDAMQVEPQADGVSFGRWPDGAEDFYPLSSNTPGTNNSAIWIGDIVINELMYDPISGNDDDQYIELYNQGTNTVSLANWQFSSGISFIFPANTTLGPNAYLVLARNQTNLFAKYPNLSPANTLGDYGGRLSHKGERVALAMPQLLRVNGVNGATTNVIYVVEDEVTYGTGGRWGQWSHGGGSSLELINPNTNHRLAYNWTDSDETAKSVWTNLEYTGVLDLGGNYGGSPINLVQIGLLDVGECLVDDLEVRPGGANGTNLIANGDFELGMMNWTAQGDHLRSSLETISGLGGYQSSQSLHLRSSDGIWTLADNVQGGLTQSNLSSGQTATMRLKARWLHGWPEVLMRLRGNWLEVTGKMPVPANLGTPGMVNSRYQANVPPAIYEVKHSPPIPAANQGLVVTARFHDFNPFQPTLRYRIDSTVNPAPTYVSVPMLDNGTGGDALAADGIYTATIPGQPAGTIVAFQVLAQDLSGATSIFPQDLTNNAGLPRECVVVFGDPIPSGSFSHHHVFITHNWAQRWAQWGGVSHEYYDGTWVDGGGRIIYNWQGRYAGSPYHQYLGSPVTTLGGMHWLMPEDDQVFGTTSFNKQHVPGNGALDDSTIQREQACYWMARRIGLPFENRRYYVYYVNGNRHGPLMEDSMVPDAQLLKEYWPNDSNGILYKNHAWFEGDVALQSNGYMNVNNESFCLLGRYTTTINGVPNQYKLARYRWMWWIRQFGDSANDFSQLYALIDAANTPTNTDAYYANMESQVDTEEWLRLSAIEHATGDLDSFFTLVHWNMYSYKPTLGKWTALKWDWNISLGAGTGSGWGPGPGQLFIFSTSSPGQYGGYDPLMTAFHSYPPYRRAYLRAFQDIANLAMNSDLINPMLDAKYAAFAANGLTTTAYGVTLQDPAAAGGLESWIGTMHDSLISTLQSQGVSDVAFAIDSSVVSNNVVLLSGTAPIAVKTLWFNGIAWPVTWSTITNWNVMVPLNPGTNQIHITGVDLHGQPVAGASTSVTLVFGGATPSPVGQVVINEIMYQPSVDGADFIELYNNSLTNTFDLSGWELGGLNYSFPAGSLIKPNNFLVLAANRSMFSAAYGGRIPLFDTYSNSLASEGQRVILMTPATNGTPGVVVAEVQYGNSAPWPSQASIKGYSLQLVDPDQDNWRVGNWATGPAASAATPGNANSDSTLLPPFPPLWVNEIEADNLNGLTNSVGQHSAWLELFNPTTNAVPLGGLYLSTNYSSLTDWAFPSGTTINPGEFKLIFADGQVGLATSNELHTSFTLGSGSGSLALSRLYLGQPQVLDYLDYTNLTPDHSYGSVPDGQSFVRQEFAFATPGGSNNAIVPFSFIPYATVGQAYFQNFDSLPNPGMTSVNTANPVTIDGITYSLADPFDFAFPALASGNDGGLGLAAMAGWYGWSALLARFGATDGDQTTGGQISFGPAGSSNRALGLLATSTTGATAFGAKLINQTGRDLHYITLGFTGALWRQSNLPKVLLFYYAIDPTAAVVFPPAVTAFVPGLNVSFPTSAAAVGGIAVDGTAAVNQATLSVGNLEITNWPANAALWLVWEMPDATGKAQGLAIDNLTFLASDQPLQDIGSALTILTASTNLVMSWAALPGQSYQIEYKDDLNASTWTALGASITATGSFLSVTNTPSAVAQRFYRLRILP